MNYKPMKCYNCGSNVVYDEEHELYKCEYCGVEYAKNFKLKEKTKSIKELKTEAEFDFDSADYEYAYRKYCAIDVMEPNNPEIEYKREVARILKQFHHPDAIVDWEDAFILLKKVYDSDLDDSIKTDCFDHFIVLATEVLNYRSNNSLTSEELIYYMNYVSKYIIKIYNEIDLSVEDKNICLDGIETIVREGIEYFTENGENDYVKQLKDKLEEVLKERKND